ncbi:MAG: DNA-binding transcriptional regulator [Variovorax sp.]
MASFPPVRAVERALELLQCLNRQSVSTLDMLHRQTGLPKPSLIRLLETLIAKGLVKRAPQYGAYYLTSVVQSLSCGYHGEPRIIEAASAVMDALTRDFKWPVALAVPERDAVVIRYSTIARSPLSLLHSSLNMRLSMASRALGRAYLAFCSEAERKIIVQQLAQSNEPEDAPARNAKELDAVLDEIRGRGYALRSPLVRPVSNTLALPILEGEQAVATLGLTWFSSTMSPEAAIKQYLPRLKSATQEISARLATTSDQAGIDVATGERPSPRRMRNARTPRTSTRSTPP